MSTASPQVGIVLCTFSWCSVTYLLPPVADEAGDAPDTFAGRPQSCGTGVRNPAGHPVFLMHGTPGSRVAPLPRSMILHALGVRLDHL